MLKKFIISSDKQIKMPMEYSRQQRHLVHQAAESYGLDHRSEGNEPRRQLTVFKPDNFKMTPKVEQELGLAKPEDKDDTKNKKKNCKKVAKKEEISYERIRKQYKDV